MNAEHRRPFAAFLLVCAFGVAIMANGLRDQVVRVFVDSGAPRPLISAVVPDIVLGHSLRNAPAAPEPAAGGRGRGHRRGAGGHLAPAHGEHDARAELASQRTVAAAAQGRRPATRRARRTGQAGEGRDAGAGTPTAPAHVPSTPAVPAPGTGGGASNGGGTAAPRTNGLGHRGLARRRRLRRPGTPGHHHGQWGHHDRGDRDRGDRGDRDDRGDRRRPRPRPTTVTVTEVDVAAATTATAETGATVDHGDRDRGDRGDRGDHGDRGDRGPGRPGDRGDRGDRGRPAVTEPRSLSRPLARYRFGGGSPRTASTRTSLSSAATSRSSPVIEPTARRSRSALRTASSAWPGR